MNILVGFRFFAILIFLHSNASSQNVEAYCRKAYFPEDSSGYYFNLAKTHIKNKSDQANWYFTKQFRATTRGENDSALFYHFKVFDYIQRLDTLQIGFTYNNIGNSLLKKKQFTLAKNWIERALKIAQLWAEKNKQSMDSYDTATNYMNLATIESEWSHF